MCFNRLFFKRNDFRGINGNQGVEKETWGMRKEISLVSLDKKRIGLNQTTKPKMPKPDPPIHYITI
jgi:hypothetical protein